MSFSTENPQLIQVASGTVLLFRSGDHLPAEPSEKKARERSIAQQLLRDHLQDPAALIHHEASGKPFVANRPDLRISVSHSGTWLALCISLAEAVGVDVQIHTSNLSRGLDYFINDREKQVFGNQFTDDQLYVIWCAKEAFYKKLGGTIDDLREDVSVLNISKQSVTIHYENQEIEAVYLQDEVKTLVVV